MQRKHLAILLSTAFVLTACSDTVGGTGHALTTGLGSSTAPATSSAPTSSTPSTSTAPSTSSAPSTTSAAGGKFPTDAKSLGTFLAGNRTLKTAHVALNESAGGTTVVSTGVERFSNVVVEGMDLSEAVNGSTLRFIILGTKVYAKLPPATYHSTKPWVEMNASTTNPELKTLYASFESARTAGVGIKSDVITEAAKNIRLIGVETLDGVKVGHYSITVDVASLPSDFPNRSVVEQSGLAEIPVEIFADEQGRTRQVVEHFTISGQTVDLNYHITKLDQPVSITAPPASQVEQG